MKLLGAKYLKIQGEDYVCIPPKANPTMYVGQKGIYLNVGIGESKPNEYGNSHFIVASIANKELRDSMSEEEKRLKSPIIGNLKAYKGDNSQTQAQEVASNAISLTEMGTSLDNEDDIPF